MQKTSNKKMIFLWPTGLSKRMDVKINDRKAHCPQTSYNKTIWVTVVAKESNLPNSKIRQANGIINRTSSTIK
jgi:hypothetical protein